MPISYGDLVICADPKKPWYGWIGVVRGKNKGNIGIEFDEDASEPPKATGRWVPKPLVVRLSDLPTADPALQEAVARYRQWSTLLAKARESATLAVETYNRPSACFRTGAFASLMIIAWTSLLLAVRVRRGHSPYEIHASGGGPKQIGDELRFLGLSDALPTYFGPADAAITRNLGLFIRLRNKIEHADVPGLDEKVLGETQALLRNFEKVLVQEFGRKYGINGGLVFPVTFSYAPPSTALDVLRAKTSDEAQSVFEFIDQFRRDLPDEVIDSQEYSYRVFLLPRLGNHRGSADVAIQWIQVDPNDPQAAAEVEHRVAALLKVKHVQVQNLGKLTPGQVSERIRQMLQVVFGASYQHVLCCKHFGAWKTGERPKGAEECDQRYCVFDVAHDDVVYTDAWLRLLLQELATSEGQIAVFGKPLTPTASGVASSGQ